MLLRLARIEELALLEDLQRRASLELGEYRDALLAQADAIVLPAEQIERGEVLVSEIDGRIAGFAVVLERDGIAELDGLFVEPDLWRRGIGSTLVAQAVHDARHRGLSLMTVVANPAAKDFYERCGFTVEGAADTRFGPALRMSR
ncbi:GNAT family N-acetyltransferase [Sphingomonas sp.]|uniref:GNAT family N-acetyltransferase n=1 Tax=Sphingomonas sp. TaxID=28214 RepID=UPI0017A2B8C8|nr:GNAT family N-acetyltransferase [Sphingomonas sp.]MBA3512000.1 GNAT family N-acetyltransferase [Sphingomonas sp.]